MIDPLEVDSVVEEALAEESDKAVDVISKMMVKKVIIYKESVPVSSGSGDIVGCELDEVES